MNKHELLYDSIQKGLSALLLTVSQSLNKEIDLERTVRLASLLQRSGVDSNNCIFRRVAESCVASQKDDGGWIGVEDSTWSVAFLKSFDRQPHYLRGLNWLKEQQLDGGGWGKTSRDVGRIPITGLLLYLLPELSDEKSLCWLEMSWEKDLAVAPALTYKGAISLMALRSTSFQLENPVLLTRTLNWLGSQQNADFGWGPWKGHPVGSSPFCTGVALVGLLQYPERVDRQAIANGLEWIRKKQLDNGLWADHYVEEGSAWCFFALTQGYRFLKGSQ